MQVLRPDDTYEEVKCPICGRTWWAEKVFAVLSSYKTIRCPGCDAPLKPPVMYTGEKGPLDAKDN